MLHRRSAGWSHAYFTHHLAYTMCTHGHGHTITQNQCMTKRAKYLIIIVDTDAWFSHWLAPAIRRSPHLRKFSSRSAVDAANGTNRMKFYLLFVLGLMVTDMDVTCRRYFGMVKVRIIISLQWAKLKSTATWIEKFIRCASKLWLWIVKLILN